MNGRRIFLISTSLGFAGCAGGPLYGTPLDPRGPHGLNYQTIKVPDSPFREVDFRLNVETAKYGPAVASQMSYLLSDEFASYFASEFEKTLTRNNLVGSATVNTASKSPQPRPLLSATVIDVILYYGRLNRLSYLWELKDQQGSTLSTWQSVSMWERDWTLKDNKSTLTKGIHSLALFALNSLDEQKFIRLPDGPARTPTGRTNVLF